MLQIKEVKYIANLNAKVRCSKASESSACVFIDGIFVLYDAVIKEPLPIEFKLLLDKIEIGN